MKELWKFLRPLPWWLKVGLLRKPFVWEACNEGDQDYTEPWNYKTWMAVRPRYYGAMKRLPCGCSRRFGRIVLYAMNCKKHGLRWDPSVYDEPCCERSYICPTSGESECTVHGGFDNCCDHPDCPGNREGKQA